jgi:KUP system potassium uptake protein
VARERFGWKLPAVLAFAVPFLIIDLAFFGANVIKIGDGGWFPITVGATVFTLMTTWFTGRRILTKTLAEGALTVEEFVAQLASKSIHRVRGTAIFMTRQQEGIPTAMLHNIKHNKVVHERVVLLSVNVEETPHLDDSERVEWIDHGEGIHRLVIRFGFMEDPDLPALLERLPGPFKFSPMSASYFLGRETLIPTRHQGMAIWREHLFVWMNRNASSASAFFALPPNQVIELGAQVRI